MKNLLIYINPRKDFDEEGKVAIKIQIDNSLDLGWKKEDILLVTNFQYEYKGVKSLVIPNDNYCTFSPTASKINAIVYMFENKLIKKGEIYWFHDLDAYQLQKIAKSELEFDNITDILLSDFGRLPRWTTESFFFKNSSEDIFNWVKDTMYKYSVMEEEAISILTGHDTPIDHDNKIWIKGYTSHEMPEIENLHKRIKKLNISYNFHSFNVRSNYAAAIKPIKVAHFHFMKPINPENPRPNQIDFFLRGINKIEVQIVPDRLIKIFNQYGVK